jgi:hypothetical protein
MPKLKKLKQHSIDINALTNPSLLQNIPGLLGSEAYVLPRQEQHKQDVSDVATAPTKPTYQGSQDKYITLKGQYSELSVNPRLNNPVALANTTTSKVSTKPSHLLKSNIYFADTKSRLPIHSKHKIPENPSVIKSNPYENQGSQSFTPISTSPLSDQNALVNPYVNKGLVRANYKNLELPSKVTPLEIGMPTVKKESQLLLNNPNDLNSISEYVVPKNNILLPPENAYYFNKNTVTEFDHSPSKQLVPSRSTYTNHLQIPNFGEQIIKYLRETDIALTKKASSFISKNSYDILGGIGYALTGLVTIVGPKVAKYIFEVAAHIAFDSGRNAADWPIMEPINMVHESHLMPPLEYYD